NELSVRRSPAIRPSPTGGYSPGMGWPAAVRPGQENDGGAGGRPGPLPLHPAGHDARWPVVPDHPAAERHPSPGQGPPPPYGGHPPFGQAPPGATHQGWGGPPPSGPGKKTMGVLAGVLAIFCFILLATTCGVSLFQIIRTQIDTNPMTRAYPTHVAVTVACVLAALLFLIGAIRHLKRGRSGSVIVLVAAVIVVAVAVLQWVDMTAAPGDETV